MNHYEKGPSLGEAAPFFYIHKLLAPYADIKYVPCLKQVRIRIRFITLDLEA